MKKGEVLMQIQQVSFQGNNPKHGARRIGQVMNKLYDTAYRGLNDCPDIIQVSTRMKDGVEVTGVAAFDKGHFVNLSFPYEHAHYRREFCENILRKFNEVITKGKIYK